jgi:hypothetical protein
MTHPARRAAQLIVVAALFGAVAAFADWPRYRQLPDGSAVILLSFVHGADRRSACRKLTPDETARLAPNMRKAQDCPRGRLPVQVELEVDDRTVFAGALPPTGIAGDGPSRVYSRFVVPAGEHDVVARMRDTARPDGFDHELRERVALDAGQLLVVDFQPEAKQFVFR